MDFDDAKENIQPLAQGRNASILHASLRVESPQELLVQRKVLEKEIHNYSGDDPLSAWYDYIEWIEQSFPSAGKESGLQEVLSKCLAEFESDERYKQDRRMIKLYIKFIDSHKDPAECYKQLFSAGIGTMVADFYIAWAYCYDLVGNTRMADEIFLRGIACRAQPLEELQEARQHFGFSVAQRFMYKDDDPIREETNRQLHERRVALTSLRGHRRKQTVGSIRTGSAVKSVSPGKVKIEMPSTSSQRGNIRVQVFKDENETPNITLTPSTSVNEVGKSVVRSIIDAARNQENQKEPGPWNKAHNRNKNKLFGNLTRNSELGFEIHEDAYEDITKICNPPIHIADNEIKFDKPFIYLPNFCAISKSCKEWITPVTKEEIPDVNTIPEYKKFKLYPRPNMEFQPEELKGYNILKKRGISNNFTKKRDAYWCNGPKYNIRLYPHFATKSKPQTIDSMDQFFIPEKLSGMKVAFEEIYNIEDKIERQFEEILVLRIKRNKTSIETADMEETMCTTNEKMQVRKSFFPSRKSLAPSTFKMSSVMPELNEKYGEITTVTELPPSPSICAERPKATDEQFEAGVFNKSKVQKETDQELRLENTVPIASELALNDDKSLNLLFKKTSNTKLQADVVTERNVNDAVSKKTFEIFKDSSVELSCIKSLVNENDFQFKTPALPIPNTASMAAVSNKLAFEIFDDENLGKQSPNSMPKHDFDCGNGRFFDPEETCSTQTFNICLKAQSVSTPKVIVKSKPQRQFGNILKEVTQPMIPEQKDDLTDNQNYFPDNQNHASEALPIAAYSPPPQQLSTILETSEHGTTQGTHTTGATTKSTLSSPEFDLDSQAQTTTTTGTNQPQTVLETVKELSFESSVIMMNSLKIQNMDTNTSETPLRHPSEKKFETPGSIRLQKKCTKDGSHSSFFDYSIKHDQRQVGNFSRLEEKEDTATGTIFKTLPPIRFQDDKTETISKMLITSHQFKFQDDKTETIPKMLFEPLIQTKFQDDKTENISKMLMARPQTIKFAEDEAETISKFMLTPPEPTKFGDHKTELEEKENNQQKNMNQDNIFEFFGQTPPKATKQSVTKQIEPLSMSHIRTSSNNRTPLTFESKRFCDKDTPDIQKIKSISKPTVLFEDELQSYFTNEHPTNVKDSFFSDFSLIGDNQRVLGQNKAKSKSKSVFRDSFIPDFSIIENSHPQTKLVLSENQHESINQSILPEFSSIKNIQSKSSKPEQNNSRNISLLSEKHLAGNNNSDKYFELNCETEMFGANISMMKNSTWLPNHGPSVSENAKQISQIHEKSLHIKSEEVSSKSLTTEKSLCNNNFSIEISESELAAINAKSFSKHIDNTPIVISESPEQNNSDNEMSIYYKQTPKTPKSQVHIWDDADAFKPTDQNQYVHTDADLNQTHQVIENMFIDPNVNPFNVDLINAFLEQHYVISYLKSLPTCQLVGCIQRLKQNATININGNGFDVIKLIGEGAYGAIFCGKQKSTNTLVAMKQEKPPNCWEYYICLEIQERIRADEMLQAYMSVDYALIGNNSSILISKFSHYGSLITVCNKVKKHTMKNVDEYVVMLLASELLEIMDHLHAVNIIHADVKADNFLLMNKLTYPPTTRHLQLIDFGVSIDMKLFKEGQTFSFVHNDNSFNCPEMRERRPWTYQLDLYGLAGVIHVLLFGKYMEIEKNTRSFWMHKTHVPRYLNKNLWDEIFKTLLNIRDCNSMPNLQELRALLKKEMEEKEKYVLKMVNEFNRSLPSN